MAVALLCVGACVLYAGILNDVLQFDRWIVWSIAPLWLYNAVLFLSFIIGGMPLAKLLRLKCPPADYLLFSMALGLIEFYLGMYLLGTLRLFNLTGAIALSVVLLASGAHLFVLFLRREYTARSERNFSLRDGGPLLSVLMVGAGAIGLALVYFPLLTPAPLNYDAVWCHLTVAQDYAREGRIVPFTSDYARNVPQLAPIIHTWGWLMPLKTMNERWMMPLHTEFFMFVAMLLGVVAIVQYLLDDARVRGTWTVFVLFPAIYIYDCSIGGAADHFLAFFAAPLFLASARATQSLQKRYLILVGLMAGGALSTKYQGIYLVTGSGVILAGAYLKIASRLAWTKWKKQSSSQVADTFTGSPPTVKDMALAPLIVVVASIVIVGPHFARNWIFYGNPIYPFGQDWIASRPTLPNATSLIDTFFKYRHPGAEAPLGERLATALRLVFTFSFEPHYSFTKNWPSFGSIFTLLLPVIPFVKKPGRLFLGAVAALVSVFTWAMVMQVDRNLQIIAPLMIAVGAALIVRVWEMSTWTRVAIVPVIALQLVWGADAPFLSQDGFIHQSMRRVRNAYDGVTSPQPLPTRINYVPINAHIPKEGEVLFHYEHRTLGIERSVILDWPGFQGLISYDGIFGPRALQKYYLDRNILTVVDQPNSRPSWSMKDEIIFADFARRLQNKHSAGFRVSSVPRELFADDPEPYLVATLGLSSQGYADGIYSIKDMSPYTKHIHGGAPRPKALLPWPSEAADQKNLLGKVAALCATNDTYRHIPRSTASRFEREVTYAKQWNIYFPKE